MSGHFLNLETICRRALSLLADFRTPASPGPCLRLSARQSTWGNLLTSAGRVFPAVTQEAWKRMSQERPRRPANSSPNDDDNLFSDLLNGSRPTRHRQPISIVGGVIYCVLLTGNFPAILGFPSEETAVTRLFYFQPEIKATSSSSFRNYLLWIIMFIEVICGGSFMSLYLGCVHQYNSLNGQPDVLKFFYSSLHPSNAFEETRYHDGDRLSDQHMALLQYQQENLHYLSEEILRLQECLSKYEQTGDGNNTSVDLAHLLAARDQELRSLSAEMNQVQSELHLARDLIAERDSEVQRIRAMNSQYVEENERLRAILGEWSARAAKLERALEAERFSNMELQRKIPKARHPPSQSSERNED